jgi:DNA-binding SARP family transcriptional activator/tetratricopeptide (TPR) repeat protein
MLNQNELPVKEFRLELFGGPTLYRGDSVVRLSPQESLLVGLLGAFGPEGVDRDTLLDLFWHTGTRSSLRFRLSQILHMVRKKSGRADLVVQRDRRLYLSPTVTTTDLSLLQTALDQGEFRRAVSLVQRDFLRGALSHDTHLLSGLIDRMRIDITGRVRATLSQAVHEAEAGADFPSMSELASLQLQFDPDDEASLRRLVKALAAQGRPREAKAAYIRFCEDRMRSCASWTASAASQALFSTLAHVSSDAPWIKRHLRHVGSLSLPMLGREDQRAVLQGILNSQDNSRPRLIVITADPGIGRSRILHETLRDVELSGSTVLFAKCGGGAQSRSLHPVTEALTTSSLEDLLDRMDGTAPRIIRETVLVRPHAGSASATDTGKTPYTLTSICESLVQLFLLIAHLDNLVIALDDTHLADPDTLHLITYMIRRGLPPQVTILLAVDESDPGSGNILGLGEPFTHLVDSYVLPLGPLQEDSLERLAMHILGKAFPGELVSAIASLSGGSPKQATELCQLLQSSTAAAGNDVYEAFAALVATCFNSLPSLLSQILQLLAVANASLPVRCIGELLRVPDSVIRSSVGGLSLGWVRMGAAEYSLAHPLLASTLYDSIPARERRLLHISLAMTLEGLEDFGRSNQIATHLVRGSENRRAVEWIERAIERAGAGFDPAPSVALAEQLLRSGISPEERMRLHAVLGRHWLRLGEAARSFDHSEGALSVRRAFETRADLLRGVEVTRLEALVLGKERAFEEVLAEIQRLLRELTEESQWDLLARVCHVALRFVDSGGLPALEHHIISHLTSIIRPHSKQLLREHVPLALVFCSQLRKGRDLTGQAVLDSALKVLREDGDEAGVARALQIDFMEKYHSGSLNSPEGIQARRDCLEVAEALQDSMLFCRHHLNTAVWFLDTFDLEGAAKAISLSQEYASHFCPPQLSRELLFNRAELLLQEGKAHDALKLFLEGFGNSPTQDPDAGALLFAAGAACCYARMRREDEARSFLPPVSFLSSHWSVDLSLLLHAHGALATGEGARLALLAHCEQALKHLRRTSVTWYLKALHQNCEIRKRFGLPAPRADVLEGLRLCAERQLPYIVGRLQPHARS